MILFNCFMKIRAFRRFSPVVLLSFICLWGALCSAQETSVKFVNLTSEDGISQNSIICIFQDKEGFLWLGTYGGLNRYDGYSFKIYQYEQGNPNSLVNSHVRSVTIQDTSGAIVVGTFGGMGAIFPLKPINLSILSIFQMTQTALQIILYTNFLKINRGLFGQEHGEAAWTAWSP